jgi:hypothetical protein
MKEVWAAFVGMCLAGGVYLITQAYSCGHRNGVYEDRCVKACQHEGYESGSANFDEDDKFNGCDCRSNHDIPIDRVPTPEWKFPADAGRIPVERGTVD